MQFAAFRHHGRVQVLAAGVAISALLAGAGKPRAAECGDLAGKVFGQATIVAATSVSPPSSLLGKDPPTPVAVRAPFCRVQGVIKPSDNSDIGFEVWLPPQKRLERQIWRDWQRRLRGLSDSSFDGLETGGGLCGLRHRHRSFGRLAGCSLGYRPSREDRRFRLARNP